MHCVAWCVVEAVEDAQENWMLTAGLPGGEPYFACDGALESYDPLWL